ncbi:MULTISPECIES: mechanosensitive ion channel family protein [Flavobacterium]|uniref:Mechanosensitive ion channel n=1 Tax=Flavobacterium stagni TaxID=2506421 RepID=A0A4Q1KC85_9FLAO|nr:MULTISPECIES: mechanosensitive ion channel domain-containing protein [Flavobacterium]RXR24034.1 mechanosensitive ion channel [Flavobacterium stagni]
MLAAEEKYVTSVKDYSIEFYNVIIDYVPRLVSAFVILLIGLYAIRFISRMAKKIMEKKEVERTLAEFLSSSLLWSLRALLFVTFISKLGIETTSFVAILGAAGLAIGMSLQGSLSNFAGGVLIIIFKPFRVGDTIEAQGAIGTVTDIQIFVTKLVSGNNQTILIPNGILSNGIITNYSVAGKRRADLMFSLSYDTDIKAAKTIVLEVMNNHPNVLKTPAPEVLVRDLTDSAIHLAIRPWSKNEDFGKVSSDILEQCKTAFDEKGITIQPFVRDVSK